MRCPRRVTRVPLVALFVLGACSTTTSRAANDAAIDSAPRADARVLDAYLPDAWAQRPCDAPPTFAAGFAPSRILHVSPGAVNGDGTSAAPFGSIAAAAAIATPGTFIQLAPGNHAPNQFIPNLRGTPTAPIWIGGVWGTQPKITGGAEALHLTRPAYVVIQNLEVASQTANGINIDDGVTHAGDAEAIAIVNVNAHHISGNTDSACFKVAGVNGLAIYDSRVGQAARGVDLIGVHGGVIARNAFQTTFGRAVVARGGSTDVDIRQNHIRDGGSYAIELGGVTPPAQFRPALSTTSANAEARRLRAFDNFVVGDMNAAVSFNTCVDCLVAHNFIGGTPFTLVRIARDTLPPAGYAFEPTKNGRIINNSFTWTVGFFMSHVDTGPNTAATTFTFSHNLWMSLPSLPVSETGSQISEFSGYDTHSTFYCDGPETGTAELLLEIDGTYDGFCRSVDLPTIGPQIRAGCEL